MLFAGTSSASKKLLPILALMFFCAAVQGQPYFCDKPSTELHYVRTVLEDGSVKWTNILYISSVDKSADGSATIHYTMMRKSRKGKDEMKNPAELSVRITPVGDTVMGIDETMMSSIKGFFPRMNVTARGADSILPGNMTPGDSLPEASAVATVMGVNYNVKVIERKVVRNETITVPAGTFDCVVVSEHKIEKAPGYNRDTVAETWYARGVGMVRHDTFQGGECVTSEVLVSIKSF